MITLGQKVITTDGYATTGHHNGEVVKIGRVWIDVRLTTGNISRFRMDNQTDGGSGPSSGRFYTLDQWNKRQQQLAAGKVLREHGITLKYDSPWCGREPELAALLTAEPVK